MITIVLQRLGRTLRRGLELTGQNYVYAEIGLLPSDELLDHYPDRYADMRAYVTGGIADIEAFLAAALRRHP